MASEKILLVDDHKESLEWLGDHLKSLGWDVIAANGGREALEKVRRTKPNLILLDMEMPEINGFEVARSLREDPDYRDIPILAVTALSRRYDRERCLAAGCNDFLSKPFTPQALQRHLANFLPVSGSPAWTDGTDGSNPRDS
ncbi:MAG: response regulator, partial [Candidatus Binatia bacterium]